MSVFTRDFWLLRDETFHDKNRYKFQVSVSTALGGLLGGASSFYYTKPKAVAIGMVTGLITCRWIKWLEE